ncbi:MAG: hypothetical protein IIA14_16570 [SAR324 cluster bacterium]|nr:hypothetical protein [SAR324 cluster bacterium]
MTPETPSMMFFLVDERSSKGANRPCRAQFIRVQGIRKRYGTSNTGRTIFQQDRIDRAVQFAEKVAAAPSEETQSRRAASALYHATSAALMTWEAARIAREAGDARRLILARFVLEHRLSAQDPLESDGGGWEEPAIALLLREGPVKMEEALAVVS